MLLLSAIKRALGRANVSPSLDFESETTFNNGATPGKIYTMPGVSYNQGYNPFNPATVAANPVEKANRQNWESMFEGFAINPQTSPASNEAAQHALETVKKDAVNFTVLQLNQKYIVTTYNQNVLIVDQQRAHERIVYEHYMHARKEHVINSQQLLFPEQIELGAGDFSLVRGLLPEFKVLGFDIEIFGKNSIVVNGAPDDLKDFNVVQTIEGIIETFKLNTIDVKIEKRDNLCRAIAKNISVKYGKVLDENEMKLLLNGLFECENPLYTANGKVVMMDVEYNEIEKYFKR
jgi:DNA mismatch repair protein MutL